MTGTLASSQTSVDTSAKPRKVAILGFGTVGSSVARILCDLQPSELALTYVFNRAVARKRVDWLTCPVEWSEDADQVLASDVDIVVELAGGLDPAGKWVRRALEAGKSVVTANKKLIAAHGVELEALARSRGCQLLYGAAVAGGIPVIPGLQQGLAGDQCHRIEGILNGTCNFILSKMEAGAEFSEALREAQMLGYAEADPTEDVAGYDARAKLTILSRIALGAQIHPEDVPAGSIVPDRRDRFRLCARTEVHHPANLARPACHKCDRGLIRWIAGSGDGGADAGSAGVSPLPGRAAPKTWCSSAANTAETRSFPATGQGAIPLRSQ